MLNRISKFLNENDYDLRKHKDTAGRWIDQKCTPDVVWSISDFILNYIENVKEKFTASDIWKSEYAKLTIKDTFAKPDTDAKSAENEYDKVFSQPLCMLCYAGIIQDIGIGKRHLYVVKEKEMLEYIGRGDSYSLKFLQLYIEKVLNDSGLYYLFEDFFKKQTEDSFYTLKDGFVSYYHTYTKIKKDYEPKRIFSKVLNPLSFKYKKYGTKRGHMSKEIILWPDLMYNRSNFKDIYSGKPKDISRKDWEAEHPEIKSEMRLGYFEQILNASKRILKEFNSTYRDNVSELTLYDPVKYNDFITATQMHHIFPQHEFPTIKHYKENLISITSNQHFNFAHPDNNTNKIDKDAQRVLIAAKANSIRRNLNTPTEPQLYTFDDFLYVLATGYDDDGFIEIEQNDYTAVLQRVSCKVCA